MAELGFEPRAPASKAHIHLKNVLPQMNIKNDII
jgi:hypothetical protein